MHGVNALARDREKVEARSPVLVRDRPSPLGPADNVTRTWESTSVNIRPRRELGSPDRPFTPPVDLLRRLGADGLLCAEVPADHGGLGWTSLDNGEFTAGAPASADRR
jgi:alkylation response protein AidB-like acyl-CoA dehydrogenase